MLNFIRRLNRFFVDQALYPILFSSALAIVIYMGRVIFARYNPYYRFLVWNLFLAWIPYLSSLLAEGIDRRYPRRWWAVLVPGLIWLAFFPNAPYIVTDFLHLQKRPDIPLWYDIILLASFAWTGIFLAISSLRTMQFLIAKYLGRVVSWGFVGLAMALSGLGIYLGRFERWNSWDLLTNPKGIMKDVAIRMVNPFDNLGFFGFTILYTAFLMVCYLSFISIRKMGEGGNK
jgi:uncharacterized membrane protein